MKMENIKVEDISEEEYEIDGYAGCGKQEHCLTDCWFMHNSVASVND